MLKQRILTAIVLLAVLLAALLAPSRTPFLLLLALTAACALWEWLRLIRDAALLPLARWRAIVAAICTILAVWVSLTLLYQTHGAWLLVSLMALVWCADIAAYFTGRAVGRHKLAPTISPGKTWEGAAGGVIAAVVWTLASAQWQGSFGAALIEHYSLAGTIVLAALLAALSIVGDLYESFLKRRAGVKDSSQLLPGHGGVLDRIDALLPVAPAAYCLLHFAR